MGTQPVRRISAHLQCLLPAVHLTNAGSFFRLQDEHPLSLKPFPAFPGIASLPSGPARHSVYSLFWCLSHFILITCLHSAFPTGLDLGPFKDRIIALFISVPSAPPHSHHGTKQMCTRARTRTARLAWRPVDEINKREREQPVCQVSKGEEGGTQAKKTDSGQGRTRFEPHPRPR